MSVLESLRQSVVDGQTPRAKQLADQALAEGYAPDIIFSQALSPAMDEVGKRMQRGEVYIPEVLVSAKAMKVAAEVLKPVIVSSGSAMSRGKVVMGTVQGDLHDIGKNLVTMMLEGAGFEVIDLGADVPAERFVQSVRDCRPQVLGMSALLTTTMLQMPKVIEQIEKAGLRSGLRVMVGGAPVNQKYADEIGADGFGMDASSAVDLARGWIPGESGGLN